MAELIIPPDYCQVQMVWTSPTFDSGGATTSFGLELGALGLSVVPLAALDAWQENVRGLMDSSITLSEIRAIDASTGFTTVPEQSGTNTGVELLAPNTSVLIRLTTASRGRRGRGRMFWPGLAYEVQVDEAGGLLPAYQEDLTEAFQGFFLSLETSGAGGAVVLQRETPGPPNTPANPTPPISPPPAVTDVTCDSKVATQRRRLRR